MSECRQLKDCPKTPVRLEVPELPSCFPAPLSSVTWTLSPPQHGTVELTSTAGHLKQSLPGQPCSDSIMIEVAEHDGTIGHFCTQGAIQKIQVHTNVSVTLSGMAGKALKRSVLNASWKGEISGNKQIQIIEINAGFLGIPYQFLFNFPCRKIHIHGVPKERHSRPLG